MERSKAGTFIIHSLPPGGDNNNKHNLVAFYKIGKSTMKFN